MARSGRVAASRTTHWVIGLGAAWCHVEMQEVVVGDVQVVLG